MSPSIRFTDEQEKPCIQPELLRPVLPQAAPPPGISSKEKWGREPRGSTQTAKTKSLQTSLETLHKYREWQRRHLCFQPVSLGHMVLVQMRKKKMSHTILMRASSCHCNSYLVLHGERSLGHKKGITNK